MEGSSGGRAAPRVTDRDRYRRHMCDARRKVSARYKSAADFYTESFLRRLAKEVVDETRGSMTQREKDV